MIAYKEDEIALLLGKLKLAPHREWVRSEGTSGKRVTARGMDISGGDFTEEDLRGLHAPHIWAVPEMPGDRPTAFYVADLRMGFFDNGDFSKIEAAWANFSSVEYYREPYDPDEPNPYEGMSETEIDAAVLHELAIEARLLAKHADKDDGGDQTSASEVDEEALRFRVLKKITRLRGANFEEAALLGAKFVKSDLYRALFSGAYMEEADLRYVKAKKAVFRGKDTHLAYALLDHGDFTKADFEEANLYNAHMNAGVFAHANLRKANLTMATANERANFEEAKMEGAWLIMTELREANLRGAKLKDAILVGADLYKADLTGADLRNTILLESEMDRTVLEDINLHATPLRRINMQGAYLAHSRLDGSKLMDVDLSGADLSYANLTGAILDGAILRGTNLFETVLEGTDFERAIVDPKDFEPGGINEKVDLAKLEIIHIPPVLIPVWERQKAEKAAKDAETWAMRQQAKAQGKDRGTPSR